MKKVTILKCNDQMQLFDEEGFAVSKGNDLKTRRSNKSNQKIGNQSSKDKYLVPGAPQGFVPRRTKVNYLKKYQPDVTFD